MLVVTANVYYKARGPTSENRGTRLNPQLQGSPRGPQTARQVFSIPVLSCLTFTSADALLEFAVRLRLGLEGRNFIWIWGTESVQDGRRELRNVAEMSPVAFHTVQKLLTSHPAWMRK